MRVKSMNILPDARKIFENAEQTQISEIVIKPSHQRILSLSTLSYLYLSGQLSVDKFSGFWKSRFQIVLSLKSIKVFFFVFLIRNELKISWQI